MQLRLELLVNSGQLYLDYCFEFPAIIAVVSIDVCKYK